MQKVKSLIAVMSSAAMISVLVFTNSVSAASWQFLYNYKWMNNSPIVSRQMTKDVGDLPYTYTPGSGSDKFDYRASAPATNAGANTREFFWPGNEPEVLDQQTCATWSNATDPMIQQGAALRILDTPQGTKGITVTKNVWYGAVWVFNVHVWDTNTTASVPYTQIGSFDMSEAMGKLWINPDGTVGGNLKPFPWNLCSRVVGNQLTFKVWPSSVWPPSWTDAKYTRTMTLPDQWVYSGKPGWYVGHVKAGHSSDFSNMYTNVYR